MHDREAPWRTAASLKNMLDQKWPETNTRLQKRKDNNRPCYPQEDSYEIPEPVTEEEAKRKDETRKLKAKERAKKLSEKKQREREKQDSDFELEQDDDDDFENSEPPTRSHRKPGRKDDGGGAAGSAGITV